MFPHHLQLPTWWSHFLNICVHWSPDAIRFLPMAHRVAPLPCLKTRPYSRLSRFTKIYMITLLDNWVKQLTLSCNWCRKIRVMGFQIRKHYSKIIRVILLNMSMSNCTILLKQIVILSCITNVQNRKTNEAVHEAEWWLSFLAHICVTRPQLVKWISVGFSIWFIDIQGNSTHHIHFPNLALSLMEYVFFQPTLHTLILQCA